MPCALGARHRARLAVIHPLHPELLHACFAECDESKHASIGGDGCSSLFTDQGLEVMTGRRSDGKVMASWLFGWPDEPPGEGGNENGDRGARSPPPAPCPSRDSRVRATRLLSHGTQVQNNVPHRLVPVLSIL